MVALAEETGKILDVAMLCDHCNECKVWKNKREFGEVDTLQFMDWSFKHFPSCVMNHRGSAQVHVVFL